ncbi:PREDICTED: SCO-spondin-like [Hipposideros armiger]|uniref:SCO-spondin-like n=1 Tax=Hipposideros armiger TaxID=186990 RepID=A0A8B7S3F4_HIPAR|nr:PREDICTED: SCO-spondin-like [Hipposideros armiger]
MIQEENTSQALTEAPGLSGNDICPPGFFCPRGTGIPVPCRPGFYSSAPGLASEDQCQPCPPGHFCDSLGLSHTLEAELCDAGYICLGGSAVPSPSDGIHGYRCSPGFRCPPGAHSELPCEPGTFSPLSGADTCLPCPAGTYCPKATSVEPTICPKGPCLAGYYCGGGAASPTPWRNSAFPLNGPCPLSHYCPQGTLHPVPCPAGTMRSSPGGISEGSCEPCPAGSFCPSLGLSDPTGSCVAGSECPLDPAASSTMALPCPQPPGLLHSSSPARRKHNAATLLSPWAPQPCSAWLSEVPLCVQCPGSLLPARGCLACPMPPRGVPALPGLRYLPPVSSWLSLPASRHQSAQALPSTQLLPGRIRQASRKKVTALSVPLVTTAGFYCPEGSGEPTLCPPHTVAATPGAKQQEDCEPCPPGRWCKAGDPATLPCPAGHYCPGGRETLPGGPQACPEHTYLTAEGGQSRAECRPCPAGYHCLSPGLSSFEGHLCPPGHWCPEAQELGLSVLQVSLPALPPSQPLPLPLSCPHALTPEA